MMERLLSHLSATVLKCNQDQEAWPPLEACLHALKVKNLFDNSDYKHYKDEKCHTRILE